MGPSLYLLGELNGDLLGELNGDLLGELNGDLLGELNGAQKSIFRNSAHWARYCLSR
jgi:hypothetical protein